MKTGTLAAKESGKWILAFTCAANAKGFGMSVEQASPRDSLQVESLEPQEGDLCQGAWIFVVRSEESLISSRPQERHEKSDFEKIYLKTLFQLDLSPGSLR